MKNWEFKKAFDPIAEEFQEHRAIKYPFFEYLAEQSQEGFNPRQFAIYQANFLERTSRTFASVARAAEKAALAGDYETASQTAQNLFDEAGYGNPNKVHSVLLLESHNKHGERIFSIPPFKSIKEASKSPLLVPAVKEYVKAKIAIFNKPYPAIAGNLWAHELAADDMLDNFKKAFFDPYKGYYSETEYMELIEFFLAHKDDSIEGGNVEEQHEIMAREAAARACKESIRNISKMRKGGLMFLDCQANLWDEIGEAMQKAQNKGVAIPPKSDHLPERSPQRSRVVGKLEEREVAGIVNF